MTQGLQIDQGTSRTHDGLDYQQFSELKRPRTVVNVAQQWPAGAISNGRL